MSGLRPKTNKLYEMWVEECLKQHIIVKKTMDFRTIEQQNALHSQGREPLDVVNAKMKKAGLWQITAEENKYIVTKAKGGESAHNFGLAWDFDAECKGMTKRQAIIKAGIIAQGLSFEGHRLRWGGDWDSDRDINDEKFPDIFHIELMDWKKYK